VFDAPPPPDEADRLSKFEAVKRWFSDDWMRIEPKLRTSIVEGVSVFLSLFDDNPAVHRAFCPPKSAYLEDPKPGDPRPLPPLESLLESGRVLALNFPVGLNPGLARMPGVMLKLDFQRRRHPMWEWLMSHPVQPTAVFMAEMLAPLASNFFLILW